MVPYITNGTKLGPSIPVCTDFCWGLIVGPADVESHQFYSRGLLAYLRFGSVVGVGARGV